MINRIVNSYLNSLRAKNIVFDSDFENSEYANMIDIISGVNLPERAIGDLHINTLKLPINLKLLYSDFESMCYDTHSVLVTVRNYDICQYIASSLVEKLYKRCLIEDVTIPQILYIDTESFVTDLGFLISRDKNEDGRSPRLRHSIEIIYDYIYSARYVFWDRFKLEFPSYYENYLYEIIKSRYSDCLGNLFFVDRSYDTFVQGLDPNVFSVLDIKHSYDLSAEQQMEKIVLVGEEAQDDK